MDPVGSGWPYAYNRLVAATAASSGNSSGNFGHLTSGGTTTAHHTPGSVTATPLLVQPTATVATTVNPYGATSFLAPPTVGYDVFSTLFHPHAAAAAQVNSQAVANLKSLNYSTPIDATQGRSLVGSNGSLMLNQVQHQEASNSSTNSSSSSSSASQQQQQSSSTQYNYQNASISRPSANIAWNTNSSSTSGSSGQAQQQLQFGLLPSAVNSGSGSTTSNPSLATITRVNSNGCGSAAANATTTAMYENYNAQLKAHSLYQLNSHLANAAVMAMANKLNANRTTLTVPQPVRVIVGSYYSSHVSKFYQRE